MASGAVDLFLIYQFIRKLTTNFEDTEAYKLGIIDKDGKFLKKRKDLRTAEEKKALGLFDVVVINLKKLLAKIPGGKTKFATYAAALFLLKEETIRELELLSEDTEEMTKRFKDFMAEEHVEELAEELAEANAAAMKKQGKRVAGSYGRPGSKDQKRAASKGVRVAGKKDTEIKEDDVEEGFKDFFKNKGDDEFVIYDEKSKKIARVTKDKSVVRAKLSSNDNLRSDSVASFSKKFPKQWKSHKAVNESIQKLLEAKNNANRSASGYDIYHKAYYQAIQHALAQAEKQGYEVDQEEYQRKVASGPRKPGNGKTNSFILGLKDKKTGKENRLLHMQIYNTGNSYELNMYIDSRGRMNEAATMVDKGFGLKTRTLPVVWSQGKFAVADRGEETDTKRNDRYVMFYDKKRLGTHPSLEGAKKFAKNNGYIPGKASYAKKDSSTWKNPSSVWKNIENFPVMLQNNWVISNESKKNWENDTQSLSSFEDLMKKTNNRYSLMVAPRHAPNQTLYTTSINMKVRILGTSVFAVSDFVLNSSDLNAYNKSVYEETELNEAKVNMMKSFRLKWHQDEKLWRLLEMLPVMVENRWVISNDSKRMWMEDSEYPEKLQKSIKRYDNYYHFYLAPKSSPNNTIDELTLDVRITINGTQSYSVSDITYTDDKNNIIGNSVYEETELNEGYMGSYEDVISWLSKALKKEGVVTSTSELKQRVRKVSSISRSNVRQEPMEVNWRIRNPKTRKIDKEVYFAVMLQQGDRGEIKYSIEDFIVLDGKDIDEEAPANAAGTGSNVAGLGDNPPVRKKKKKKKDRLFAESLKNVVEQEDRFAGSKVFEVDNDVFEKCRLGKKKYDRYENYVGNDELGENIRSYGRSNPSAPIILKNGRTGAMLYLKYGKKK